MIHKFLRTGVERWSGPVAAYQRHLNTCLRRHQGNRDLAFADATGSESIELFNAQGDGQVAVLRHHGLRDGMSVYDLGCGCGRTAQALRRSGWQGRYAGADILKAFIDELKRKCPGYEAYVNLKPTIVAEDASLDLIFHWSVFTHVSPEDAYLYLEDSVRALKPGGRLLFSFLEFENAEHFSSVFERRLALRRRDKPLSILDAFIHRDWIKMWAEKLGFERLQFTDGTNSEHHPATWQSIATMVKAK